MRHPVLVIHGGAGRRLPDEACQARAASLRDIGSAVYGQLTSGRSALDAVVEATRRLEDDPLFNAGLGSKLQIDGGARLSASLMDGAAQRFSGLVNVEGVLNPIDACPALLAERDRVLCGAGGFEAAKAVGARLGDPRTPGAIDRWRAGVEGRTGTVGAVALDTQGNLAAATSTGGRGLERVGRVSDSCTVAGNYASGGAAVSATGIGEDIVDAALAARVVIGAEQGGDLAATGRRVRSLMLERGWVAGYIAVDKAGAVDAVHTTEVLYWFAVDDTGARCFMG